MVSGYSDNHGIIPRRGHAFLPTLVIAVALLLAVSTHISGAQFVATVNGQSGPVALTSGSGSFDIEVSGGPSGSWTPTTYVCTQPDSGSVCSSATYQSTTNPNDKFPESYRVSQCTVVYAAVYASYSGSGEFSNWVTVIEDAPSSSATSCPYPTMSGTLAINGSSTSTSLNNFQTVPVEITGGPHGASLTLYGNSLGPTPPGGLYYFNYANCNIQTDSSGQGSAQCEIATGESIQTTVYYSLYDSATNAYSNWVSVTINAQGNPDFQLFANGQQGAINIPYNGFLTFNVFDAEASTSSVGACPGTDTVCLRVNSGIGFSGTRYPDICDGSWHMSGYPSWDPNDYPWYTCTVQMTPSFIQSNNYPASFFVAVRNGSPSPSGYTISNWVSVSLPIAYGFSQLCTVLYTVQTTLFILGLLLMLLGGAVYGGSHIMPGQSKGTLQGWAMTLLFGGIIILIIAILTPYIMDLITGQNATINCANGGITTSPSAGGVVGEICNLYYSAHTDIFVLGLALMLLGGAVYGGSNFIPGQTRGSLQGYGMVIFLGGIIALIIAALSPYIVSIVTGIDPTTTCSASSAATGGTGNPVVDAICSTYYGINSGVFILAIALMLLGGAIYGGSNFIPGQTRGSLQGYAMIVFLGGIIAMIIAVLAPYLYTLINGVSISTCQSGLTGSVTNNPVLQTVCTIQWAVSVGVFILAFALMLLAGALYGGSNFLPGSSRGQIQGYAMLVFLGGIIALIISQLAPYVTVMLAPPSAVASMSGTCNTGLQSGTTNSAIINTVCGLYYDIITTVYVLALILMLLAGAVYGGSNFLPGQTRGSLQGYAMILFLGGVIALIAAAVSPYILQQLTPNNPVNIAGSCASNSNPTSGTGSALLDQICTLYYAFNTGVFVIGLAMMLLGGAIYGGSNFLPGQTRGSLQGYAMIVLLAGLIALIVAQLAPYILQQLTVSASNPNGYPPQYWCTAAGGIPSQTQSGGLGAICTIYVILNTAVFVLALALMIIGGAVYAGAGVLPGQTRGVVQGYAMGLIIGAIVGAIIVLVAPYILNTIVTASGLSWQGAAATCGVSGPGFT